MRHFDAIYDIAADNYGMVTATQAREAGVAAPELTRWVDGGRLVRLGHGLYRLARRTPTEWDPYAEAVMLVGRDGFLYGESVLAMHGLALVNPAALTVGTPRRVRRRLPDWVLPLVVSGHVPRTTYEGIPSQTVADALLSCRRTVMRERLADAADEARARGLVTRREYDSLRVELG